MWLTKDVFFAFLKILFLRFSFSFQADKFEAQFTPPRYGSQAFRAFLVSVTALRQYSFHNGWVGSGRVLLFG